MRDDLLRRSLGIKPTSLGETMRFAGLIGLVSILLTATIGLSASSDAERVLRGQVSVPIAATHLGEGDVTPRQDGAVNPPEVEYFGQLAGLLKLQSESEGKQFVGEPRRLRERVVFTRSRSKPPMIDDLARALDGILLDRTISRGKKEQRAIEAHTRDARIRAMQRGLPKSKSTDAAIETARMLQQLKTRLEMLRNRRPEGNLMTPNPATRLLESLLAGLGAQALADLKVGTVSLFSNEGDRQTRPLGPSSSAAIEEYRRLSETLRSRAKEVPTESDYEHRIVTEFEGAHSVGDRVRVFMTIIPRWASMTAFLRCYNADGDLIHFASLTMPIQLEPEPIPTSLDALLDAIPRSVPLEPASLAFLSGLVEQFPVVSSTWNRLPESLELRKALAEPGFDLLQLGPREAFRALADQSGVDLVAVLDDRMIGLARRAVRPDGTLDAQRFFREVLALGYVFDLSPKRLIVKPADVGLSEAIAAPRAPFEGWNRDLLKAGAVDLRTFCRCQTVTRLGREFGFADAWLSALNAAGVEPLLPAAGLDIPDFYAFLGTLSDETWTRALAGEPIAIGSLPTHAVSVLRAYASRGYWEPKSPGARKIEFEPALCIGGFDEPRSVMTWASRLQSVIRSEAKGRVKDWYDVFPTFPADARELAQHVGTLIHRKLAVNLEAAMKDRYRFGTRMTIGVRFETPGATLASEVRAGVHWSDGAKAFAELPASFREDVGREIERFLAKEEPPAGAAASAQ